MFSGLSVSAKEMYLYHKKKILKSILQFLFIIN